MGGRARRRRTRRIIAGFGMLAGFVVCLAVLANAGTTHPAAARAATAGLAVILLGLMVWNFTRGYEIERPLWPLDRWYDPRSPRRWQDREQERRDREGRRR